MNDDDAGPCAANRFLTFLTTASSETDAYSPAFADAELAAIRVASRSLTDPTRVRFCADFGAALIFDTTPDDARRLHVSIIGLDGWVHGPTRSLPAEWRRDATAACEPVVKPAGWVATDRLEAFKTAFDRILAEVGARGGTARHADNSNGGHQKTPACILAIATNAIRAANTPPDADGKEAKLDCTIAPIGGFTDVGRHTGGARRPTELPLTIAAAHTLLRAAQPPLADFSRTFDELLARHALWDAERLAGEAEAALAADNVAELAIDRAMMGLVNARRHADALDDARALRESLLARALRARERLTTAAARAARAAADRFVLCPPDATELAAVGGPCIYADPDPSGAAAKATLQDRQRIAHANLQLTPRLSLGGAAAATSPTCFAAATVWLAAARAASDGGLDSALSLLVEIETLIFEAARQLPISTAAAALAAAARDEREIGQLLELVAAYDSLLSAARMDDSVTRGLSQAALASRGVLVTWATFCLVHAAAARAFPHVLGFAVAPSWHDLEHLVLEDAAGLAAMLHVCAYLRAHRPTTQPTIFSGREHERAGTDALADAVAEADRRLAQVWRDEQAHATSREQRRYLLVREKQEAVRRLRARLPGEEAWLATLTTSSEAARRAYRDRADWSAKSAWEQAQARTAAQSGVVSQLLHELALQLAAPPLLRQPLPSEPKLGARAVFYAHMPVALARLGRWSFECYQVLLDQTASPLLEAAKLDALFPTPLDTRGKEDCLNAHDGREPRHKSERGHSQLTAFDAEQPQDEDIIHSKIVDTISSSSDGVYHPQCYAPCLSWRTNAPNPFGMDRGACVESFTERLPLPERGLQWTMLQTGAPLATRGNEGPARQDLRPNWLGRQGFLAFCRLRAFPNGQLRALAAMLHNERLPLELRCTHALVLQTVCHVGALADRGRDSAGGVRMAWKADLLEGEAFGALADELERAAERLADQPRAHGALLLLGRLAAFLGSFRDEHTVAEQPAARAAAARCASCARRFSYIASGWARELDAQLAAADAAANAELADSLRAKQHIYHSIALVCFGTAGAIDAADAASICRLRVQMCATAPLLGQAASRASADGEQLECAALAQAVVASRARAVAQLLDETACTAAAACVLSDELLAGATWSSVERGGFDGGTSCFEATTAGSDHVCLSVLSGVVLFNGLPPDSLPATIVKHDAYARVFGRRNCKVVPDAGGALTTARPLAGRNYRFKLTPSGALVVHELQPADGRFSAVEYRLLTDARNATWAEQLPVRLREMHSHWAMVLATADGDDALAGRASSPTSLIVLRPVCYDRRAASFISVDAALYRVPESRADDHPLQLAADAARELDRMVSFDEGSRGLASVHVLAKLEHACFIEAYLSPPPARVLKLRLPRHALEFESERGGAFRSAEHRGYELARAQQLADTLPGFSAYLLLRCSAPDSAEMSGRPRLRVLVNCAPVVAAAAGGGGVATELSTTPDARLRTNAFDEHARFGTLIAADVCARLQLACLYAATGTLLPEPRAGMTGGEHAIELARQCWQNKPYTLEEDGHLRTLSAFARRAPALSLLCANLERSGRSLAFLHDAVDALSAGVGGQSDNLTCGAPPIKSLGDSLFDAVAAAEYSLRATLAPRNARLALTRDEERDCLGHTLGDATRGWPPPWRDVCTSWRPPLAYAVDDAAELAQGPRSSVRAVEEELRSWVVETARAGRAPARGEAGSSVGAPDFPLQGGGELDHVIGAEMLGSLRDSWEAHHRVPECALAADAVAETRGAARAKLASISLERGEREALIMARLLALADDNELTRDHALGHALRRAANEVPTPTLRDLVRASFSSALLRAFNPFLSERGVERVQAAIIDWMELCVLEDRLERVVSLLADEDGGASSRDVAVRELRTHRTWAAAEHPQWLAFEVEGGLQIRPEQHAIIAVLLSEPGRIAQLNMGLGKTRVIVPCLLLEWARVGGGPQACVVRLYFLSQLLDEAAAYLHRMLTASVLGRRMFHMPFSRDVALSQDRTSALLSSLACCRRVGGALVIAPEHRLSMLLKRQELGRSEAPEHKAVFDGLCALEAVRVVDIFDESDAILNPMRQLIYAIGEQGQLQGGERRWLVAMAVLRAIRSARARAPLLRQDESAVWLEGAPAHETDGLRLVPGEALDDALPRIYKAVLDELFRAPPRAMRWLEHADDDLRFQILEAAVNVREPLAKLAPDLTAEIEDDVLALRGLLAHGVLAHCLRKRHRVDFGIARERVSHKKRLAVPFDAADTPSSRSEFSQPDVALVFTILAYHSDGLTAVELNETFRALLEMGDVAQAAIYDEWFAACAPHVPLDDAERKSIDDVRKLDLTSRVQLALLARAYSRSTLVVDFFLHAVVLSAETVVFPHSLLATPWHLCDGAESQVGFSGTSDLAMLLPLAVRQATEGLPDELRGTDGLMLERIIALASYELLQVSAGTASVADAVIAHAAARDLSALVDVGAYMAGLSNEQVALRLIDALRRSPRGPRAVVFFDTGRREWCVLDCVLAGRRWPLKSSPVVARDAFCYFDMSRCRGADLKLAPSAVALLTLSPRLRKDELMQAAGRMRGLAYGQRLELVALPETDARVRAAAAVPDGCAIAPAHVLAFVTANSATAAAVGLTQWARQGAHFATTSASVNAAFLDDETTLGKMYAHANAPRAASDVARQIVEAFEARATDALADDKRDMLATITKRARALGADVTCVHSANEDEAEREVERQIEEEEEKELELPKERAAAEADCDWDAVLKAPTPTALRSLLRLLPLAEHARAHASALAPIAWPADVYVTTNFAVTLARQAAAASEPLTGEHLRAPDAVLVFPNGELVLISERECDKLLERLWRRPPLAAAARGAVLANFAFLRSAATAAGDGRLRLQLPRELPSPPLDAMRVAAVQLYAGETRFETPARRAVLREMLSLPEEATRAALEIPRARGTLHLVDRSELQDVVTSIEEERVMRARTRTLSRPQRPISAAPTPGAAAHSFLKPYPTLRSFRPPSVPSLKGKGDGKAKRAL